MKGMNLQEQKKCGILLIAIGLVMFAIGFLLGDAHMGDFYSGLGCGLFACGAVRLLRVYRLSRDPVGIVSTITEVGKETEATEGFGAALENILFFAAMFAVNLAVMNLLPLPALDGGHVLFLLVNGIAVALFKKEIPSKYLNVINGIGFALLMALMLFVTFHDIVKLL